MARKSRYLRRKRRAQIVRDAAAKLKCTVEDLFDCVARRIGRALTVSLRNVPSCVLKFALEVLGKLSRAQARFRAGRRERYRRFGPALALH